MGTDFYKAEDNSCDVIISYIFEVIGVQVEHDEENPVALNYPKDCH